MEGFSHNLGSRLCENAQPIAQFVMGLFVARRACVTPSSTPIQHCSALPAPPMALLGRFWRFVSQFWGLRPGHLHRLQRPGDAKHTDHALEVICERVQAHFSADVLKGLHEEVG